MAQLRQISEFISERLEVDRYSDVALNGLQVEGRAEVKRIATGVSSSIRLFDAAVEWGADAIIVHHGLFWGNPKPIVGPLALRLRKLLTEKVSLLAYHLPLDAHLEDGNNACIAKALGLEAVESWGEYRGKAIGTLGTLSPKLSCVEFEVRAREALTDRLVFLGPKPKKIRTVAVCSGGGGSMVDQALHAGADVFLTGEPGEPAQELANEAGMLVVGAGHYNTERFGVQALGERVASQFSVETKFIDVPNPI